MAVSPLGSCLTDNHRPATVLITASRSIESAMLRWSDVDLKKGRMVFRNTKSGQDYTFPHCAAGAFYP